MAKKYRFYDQNQTLIMPLDLNEWLSHDHPARFISSVVDELDLKRITSYYEKELKGAPPYDPVMMVKIRIYADTQGMPSSRKIEKAMKDDLGFRFLGAGNFPDFRTISDFRKIHLEPLARMFHQVLDLCNKAGLVELNNAALDGTKIKANASKDKNFTIETLLKKENDFEKIARKIIEDGIKVDEDEDNQYGNNNPERIPKDALERVKKAKKILEEQVEMEKEKYDKKIEERKIMEEETGKKLSGRKPKDPSQQELDSINKKEPVANITDPDSRLMKTINGFIQGYNAQIVVDTDSGIIVATELTQDHNDKNQLIPMLDQVIANTRKIPKNLLADAGYDNEKQLSQCEDRVDLYIATQKDWKQRKAMREQGQPRGRIPKNLSKRERMERKLMTKKGKALYKKRASSVEPVNGQIKSAMGLDKLLLRGLSKGRSEWKMYCMAHNLLKLWRRMVRKASIRA